MVLASHLSRGRKQELIRTPWVSPVIALNCAVVGALPPRHDRA